MIILCHCWTAWIARWEVIPEWDDERLRIESRKVSKWFLFI